MVLIFTGNEQLDIELNKAIEDSSIVYYPEYVLQELKANILITTVQPNKYNFKDFILKVREKNIRVILILENENVKELKDALMLGIYDIIFDNFSLEDVIKKVNSITPFSEVSKYFQNF